MGTPLNLVEEGEEEAVGGRGEEEEEEGAVEGRTQPRPQGNGETAATQEMTSRMRRKQNGKKQ